SSRDEATETATATRAVRASTTAPCARTAARSRARAEQQQDPSEHRVVDPRPVLDGRDMDDPHSQQETGQGEVGEGGEPGRPQ
ncbi:hypothetical protein AB0C69_10740, partial [Actinomadura sp. NPDC048032]|uniref:hypothetical protein n=1 Tax=Actinomadura sp. NPDC048032 TaxID=3155747 RepID=UPI00340D91C0